MKAIKYLLIGALITGFSAPMVAQDVKSDIEKMTKLVKDNKGNTAAIQSEIKNFRKAYKKNAEALTALGRAYLDVKDTANAQLFAETAIKVNSKYGPGYVLMGDIEAFKDNGGEASAWFEQATVMDPQNVDGYRRYAQVNSKANPAAAVAKLEDLRKVRPDYPVDIISAEIYDKAGNIKKAVSYYDKVDRSKMEDYQLAAYSTDCYLLADYQKSLEIAEAGRTRFANNAGLNRLALFNLTELNRFPEAIAAGNALLTSDKVKLSGNDHLYLGMAYSGNKDYDNAIDQFNKAIALDANNKAMQVKIYKVLSDVYAEKGDVDSAVAAFNKYVDNADKVTAYEYSKLPNIYMAQAEKATGADQMKYYTEADKAWGVIADKFPSVADYATYQRAHIGYKLDPETKTGAAKPHYEKLIELIKAKSAPDESDKARLVEAYRYLGYYYTLHNDKALATENWKKVLEIDPENVAAKQVLGIK